MQPGASSLEWSGPRRPDQEVSVKTLAEELKTFAGATQEHSAALFDVAKLEYGLDQQGAVRGYCHEVWCNLVCSRT